MSLPTPDRAARLAASRETIVRSRVAMPLAVGFDLAARPAELVPLGHVHLLPNRPAPRFLASPVVLGRTFATVRLQAVRPRSVRRECADREQLLACRALFRSPVVHGCDLLSTLLNEGP